MRAAIFNPYLDTLGGGERYTLSFAKVLATSGWRVDLEWRDESIKKSLESRFGMDFSDINIVPDIKRGDGYDLCFWLSDGSIPTLRARKNFLHFQVPFHNVGGRSLLNRMKLFRINKVICNSGFTKKFIDKEYGVESRVVYPPVDVGRIRPKGKENLILYVGRFSKLTQAKRQDALIKAFKELYDAGAKEWSLILAGGAGVGGEDYFLKLKELSKTYPIKVHKNPPFRDLKNLYSVAKIFWSAAGYGVREDKDPEKVEHFGITVVEAMAGGVVPVVYNAGGHKEIVEDGVDGWLWAKIEQLIRKTGHLIQNPKILKNMSSVARNSAQKFSYERFEKEILSLI